MTSGAVLHFHRYGVRPIADGYVGLEFAQAMRRFGSDVTIIERNPMPVRSCSPGSSRIGGRVLNRTVAAPHRGCYPAQMSEPMSRRFASASTWLGALQVRATGRSRVEPLRGWNTRIWRGRTSRLLLPTRRGGLRRLKWRNEICAIAICGPLCSGIGGLLTPTISPLSTRSTKMTRSSSIPNPANASAVGAGSKNRAWRNRIRNGSPSDVCRKRSISARRSSRVHLAPDGRNEWIEECRRRRIAT
jgi:hypothetical protein